MGERDFVDKDKLILRGLQFHGFHGVKLEEKKLGQKFVIDVDAWMDLSNAGKSDDISDTVSYTAIYRFSSPTRSYGSSLSFDDHYYVTLKQKEGLFQSDATLLTDGKSSKIVDKLLDYGDFFDAFGKSITKMGNIGVLTGTDGQIRSNCRAVNR